MSSHPPDVGPTADRRGSSDASPPLAPFHHRAGYQVSTPRALIGIVVCVLGMQAVALIPLYDILVPHWSSGGTPAPPILGPYTFVVSQQVETVLALALILTAILVICRRRLTTILSVTSRLRWAWLRTCTLAAIVTVAVVGTYALLLPTGVRLQLGTGASTPGPLITAGVLILLAGVTAVVLELLFRGWGLQALGAEQTVWTANFLQAFTFTLCHAPGLTVWGYTDVALSAVAAGWLTITTGGIEAAVALPVAWNGTLTAVTYLTIGSSDPTRAAIANDWRTLAVHLVTVCAYTAAIRLLTYRRRTLSPG